MPDWERILNQLEVVKAAPTPFIIALLIVAFFIWVVMRLIYSTVLSHRDAEIVLLKGQRDAYKDKLSGASPDEAKARIEALEARLARIEPRRLDGDTKSKFLKVLQSYGGPFEITIIAEMGGESQQYSADFVGALQSIGYTVPYNYVMGIGERPPSGLGVHINDLNAPSAAATAVIQALHQAGISYNVASREHLRDGGVEMMFCIPLS